MGFLTTIDWLIGLQPRTLYLYRPTTRSAFSPGRLEADCNTLGRGKTCYLKHPLRLGPADLYFLVGSWKLGWTAYVYVWLERSYDPPECHPGQQAYTFVIHLLSTYTSVSIFSVCCCSRYVSLWWQRTEQGAGWIRGALIPLQGILLGNFEVWSISLLVDN